MARRFVTMAEAGWLKQASKTTAVRERGRKRADVPDSLSAGGAMPSGDVGRSLVAAAQETASLVLDEDVPVPETDEDVRELVLRLRGHVAQIGAALDHPAKPLVDALDTARALAQSELPSGFMPSRVHLRKLALSVQAVVKEAPVPTSTTSEAVRTPVAPPASKAVADPSVPEIEPDLAPLSIPWRRRSPMRRETRSKRSPMRVPRLAELVVALLRRIVRSRLLLPQPMQRLVDLDESRFTQVCHQSSLTRDGGPR